jgi:RNA polymerase sigma-70 factor, ECF subfamily
MSLALISPALPARFAARFVGKPLNASTGAAGRDVLTFACFTPVRHKAPLNPPPTLASLASLASELADTSADVRAADSPAIAYPERAERAERDAMLAGLLASAAAGKTTAFESFYDATVGYARALARRMVKASDLDDLLADAFFQAWREAARFDPERGSAVTWLLTLVRSRALDLLRRQRATHEVEADTDSQPETASDLPGPDELLGGTQAGTRLHAALALLSSNERWVLGLAYYSDLSHREICEQTGLPLGTVKSLILRAQNKLRAQLTTL